jgi:hypothetical protein
LRGALEFDTDYDVQAACLLLTELVTYALLHVRTPMTVRATEDGDAAGAAPDAHRADLLRQRGATITALRRAADTDMLTGLVNSAGVFRAAPTRRRNSWSPPPTARCTGGSGRALRVGRRWQ